MKRSLLLVLFCFGISYSQVAQRDNLVYPSDPTEGVIDSTFGTNGFVRTDFSTSSDHAYGVAIQPDQKIVAVGSANSMFALARYNPNGTLDSTFGLNGKVVTDNYGYSFAWSVAIQSDRKIVAAGSLTSPYMFMIGRYDTTGNLDPTFGNGGLKAIPIPIGSGNQRCYAMALQPDGKILLAGYINGVSNEDIALLRLKTNGTLDSTFGALGIVVTDVGGGNDEAQSVKVQSDGKILVAGSFYLNSHSEFGVVRYNTNGTVDSTFNGTGRAGVTFPGSQVDKAYAMAIDSVGRILLVGDTYGGGRDFFAFARFLPSGLIDSSFAKFGSRKDTIQNLYDIAYSVALQKDNKIVVSGVTQNGGGEQNIVVARYLENGLEDTSFNRSGGTMTDMGGFFEEGFGVAIQENGSIVVAGETLTPSNSYDFALLRYHGTTGPLTDVETNDRNIPNGYLLSQNYPNPFNPTTLIKYEVPEESFVTLKVFNLLGQEIITLVDDKREAGTYEVRLDGTHLSSGIYFYRLQAGSFVETKKLILMK